MPSTRSPRRLRGLVEWLVVLAVAVGAAVLVEAFAVQAFAVPSPSMAPTILPGDRVLVDKLSYDLHAVHRGDIVVFRRVPDDPETSIHDLIKRVIGLPGETLWSGARGGVYVDGRLIRQPWLTAASRAAPGPTICAPRTTYLPDVSEVDCSGPMHHVACPAGALLDECEGGTLHLPAGEYYMMGDNRADSDDSRYWGPVPRSYLVGRAFVIFWPLSRLHWF